VGLGTILLILLVAYMFVAVKYQSSRSARKERRVFSGYAQGPWCNVNRRYLGLRFLINGKNRYGWARFNVKCLRWQDFRHPDRLRLRNHSEQANHQRPAHDIRLEPATVSKPIPEPATLVALAGERLHIRRNRTHQDELRVTRAIPRGLCFSLWIPSCQTNFARIRVPD
jgi:hypothetical protein